MLAVIPVRDGVLPSGGAETVAECDGGRSLVGSAPRADELAGVARDVRLARARRLRARPRWAAAARAHVDDDVVVLPASPDGRDLAPRLARALGRRLLAGAILVTPDRRPPRPRRRARSSSTSPSTGRSWRRCSPACAASPADVADPPTCTVVDAGRGPASAERRRRRRGAAARRRHDGPRRGRPHRRRRRRARQRGPLPPARRRRPRPRRVDGRDPR